MKMVDYKNKIKNMVENKCSDEEMNKLLEELSNDETLTNYEYSILSQYAHSFYRV